MTQTAHDKGRGEIEDLLPWYANGRLSAADRGRVEAALAVDDELARRLDLVREEMAEAIALNEAIRPRSTAAFDKLMTAIAAEPRPVLPLAAVKSGLVERIGERIADLLAGLAPRRLAFAAAAVVAVLAVQSAVVGGLLGTRSAGGGYETASQGTVAVTAKGPTLLVAFAPEARIDEIGALLKRHGASLVEGPKANGFWRLSLAEGGDAAAVATALKAEGRLVTFVQVAP